MIYVLFASLIALIIFATVGVPLLAAKHDSSQAAQQHHNYEILQRTLPDLTLSQPQPRRRISNALLILIGLLTAGVQFGLPALFPTGIWGIDARALFWGGLGLMVLSKELFSKTIADARQRQLAPLQVLRRLLVRFCIYGLPALCGLGVLAYVLLTQTRLTSLTMGALLLQLGIVLIVGLTFFGLMVWLALAPVGWVYRALKRGDYAHALHRIRFLRDLEPKNADYLFFEGTILDFAGRYAESEKLLRAAIAEAQQDSSHAKSQSVSLENLGWSLLGQERFDEALLVFQAASEIMPERGGPYHGQAEVYLRRGHDLQQALALIGAALALKRSSWHKRRVDRYVLGQMWSAKAWAEAQLGRHQEASASLLRAFAEGDRAFLPTLAGIYYRAGLVKFLAGELPQAIDYLARVGPTDPQGPYRALATAALRSLGHAA